MRFEFIAKHRGIWPVLWICEALGVSRIGFTPGWFEHPVPVPAAMRSSALVSAPASSPAIGRMDLPRLSGEAFAQRDAVRSNYTGLM